MEGPSRSPGSATLALRSSATVAAEATPARGQLLKAAPLGTAGAARMSLVEEHLLWSFSCRAGVRKGRGKELRLRYLGWELE